MDGLFAHAETSRNVLPGPSRPSRGSDCFGFEALGQPTQPGNGTQARIEVGTPYRLFNVHGR
jgi:hypothetical protein